MGGELLNFMIDFNKYKADLSLLCAVNDIDRAFMLCRLDLEA